MARRSSEKAKSSYATSAAQQQYNQYLSQLEQVVRQMYAAQRGEAVQNAQLAGGMADQEYADGRADVDWQRQRQEQEDARSQLDAMLKSGYHAWELPWELVERAGYDPHTWEALDKSYTEQRQSQQQTPRGYSGGGSGGSGGGGLDYDGLFKEAQESPDAKSFLAQKAVYQKYGFTSSTGLYDAYQRWAEAQKTSPEGKGASYNTIWPRVRTMYDQGVSDDEIVAYLRQFTNEQLTEAGWEAIATSLDLKGYRTGRDSA